MTQEHKPGDATDVPNVPPSHIVGGTYYQARGYYAGRGQTSLYTAYSEEEVIRRVTEDIKECVEAWGQYADWKYPDNSEWEIRVW